MYVGAASNGSGEAAASAEYSEFDRLAGWRVPLRDAGSDSYEFWKGRKGFSKAGAEAAGGDRLLFVAGICLIF